jgi:hypothetical protein
MATLREDVCNFMTVSRWIIFRMRSVSDKSCREKQITRFMFSNLFGKSCRLRDGVVNYGKDKQATDDNVIRHMGFACRINKATDTHSEYVILTAFPRKKW